MPPRNCSFAPNTVTPADATCCTPRAACSTCADLPDKPRRVILNVTAVHPERTLYTLNSIGFAVCPYRIQHYDQLLGELIEAGYKRRDAWRNEGKPIEVPFVDGGDKAYYAGCCFDRKG